MNDVAWALQTARGVGPVHPPHAHAHPIHKLHTGPLHSTVAGRTDHLPSNVPNGSYVLPADIVSAMGEGNTMAGFKVAKRMFEGARRHFGGMPYAGGNGPYGQSGGPYGMAKGGSATGRQYPLAPRSEWYGDANYEQTGGRMTHMSPTDYLSQTRPMDPHEETARENINDLKNHIKSGRTLDPLGLHANGKEDGRHRAHAANELGIKSVPVINWRPPQQQLAYGGQTDGVPVAVAGGEHVLAPHEVAHAGLGDMEAGHRALDAFVIRQRANTVKTLRGLPGPKRGDE